LPCGKDHAFEKFLVINHFITLQCAELEQRTLEHSREHVGLARLYTTKHVLVGIIEWCVCIGISKSRIGVGVSKHILIRSAKWRVAEGWIVVACGKRLRLVGTGV